MTSSIENVRVSPLRLRLLMTSSTGIADRSSPRWRGTLHVLVLARRERVRAHELLGGVAREPVGLVPAGGSGSGGCEAGFAARARHSTCERSRLVLHSFKLRTGLRWSLRWLLRLGLDATSRGRLRRRVLRRSVAPPAVRRTRALREEQPRGRGCVRGGRGGARGGRGRA